MTCFHMTSYDAKEYGKPTVGEHDTTGYSDVPFCIEQAYIDMIPS